MYGSTRKSRESDHPAFLVDIHSNRDGMSHAPTSTRKLEPRNSYPRWKSARGNLYRRDTLERALPDWVHHAFLFQRLLQGGATEILCILCSGSAECVWAVPWARTSIVGEENIHLARCVIIMLCDAASCWLHKRWSLAWRAILKRFCFALLPRFRESGTSGTRPFRLGTTCLACYSMERTHELEIG